MNSNSSGQGVRGFEGISDCGLIGGHHEGQGSVERQPAWSVKANFTTGQGRALEFFCYGTGSGSDRIGRSTAGLKRDVVDFEA